MTKTEYADYLASPHWKQTRELAIKDVYARCQKCALPRWLAEMVYDQDLNVHHRTYRNLGQETPDDLEVLCRRCHEIETFGRSHLRFFEEQCCERCLSTHWDRRSSLCETCVELLDDPSFVVGRITEPFGGFDKQQERIKFFLNGLLRHYDGE